MYLKEITMKNYGSIKNLNYKIPFNEDGTPKPVVIIGKNGSGKTLLLSNIIHSLVEFKRLHYNELAEVDSEKYYRIGSKSYISSGEIFSYISYKFSDESYHTELITKNYIKFKDNIFNLEEYKDIDIGNSNLSTNGFFSISQQENKKVFDNNVYLYFPVDRYYVPTWLNSENSKLKVNVNNDIFVGKNKVDMIRNNVMQDIEEWILDVIVDRVLYEEKVEDIQIKTDDNKDVIKQVITYEGKNNNIINNLDLIISKIMQLSDEKYISSRFGITNKRERNIAIINKYKDGIEREYVPKFDNLSSGQVMVLSMFASILREYDRVSDNKLVKISDIKGIVLIDEIDVHLHSDFCRKILPQAMKMFPGIQFIVSSHSPFYLLGMKESFQRECEFLNLPDGTTNNLDNFEEIQKMYELIFPNYEKTIEELNSYRGKLQKITKPLIITEGKTDWKHLKNALSILKTQGKFTELDIDFLEYEEAMGDSVLEKLLVLTAKLPNPQKIIGIFDNDEETGKKYDKESYYDFGNNTYAWCIPNPRKLPYGISIEFLYEDEDIKKIDAQGRRLYLSDEFNEKNLRLISNKNINTINKKIIECSKKNVVKIIDADVFNDEENIALSKDNFTQNIIDKVSPFDTVNVKHFEKVFERIQQIIFN